MSNHTFKAGDKAVVARPQQPTGHQGGERVTVIRTDPAGPTTARYLVEVTEDATGLKVGVWSTELDPA